MNLGLTVIRILNWMDVFLLHMVTRFFLFLFLKVFKNFLYGITTFIAQILLTHFVKQYCINLFSLIHSCKPAIADLIFIPSLYSAFPQPDGCQHESNLLPWKASLIQKVFLIHGLNCGLCYNGLSRKLTIISVPAQLLYTRLQVFR